ncbi:MAG: hypothetical protein L6R36_008189 [Xanthoria steineri]|nr:MAG: hypothetical protein L6R36_008189 [Xanthoria steineri]
MSPAVASPDKSVNRRRRKHRNTDTPQDHSSALPDEAASRQTKSDLDLPQTEMQPSSPQLPVNARPVADHTVPAQVGWPNGNPRVPKNTPKKNRNSLPNGSPQPRKSSATPRSNQRPISLTPGKSNTTPLQAYAGPTFHASPAASSLPMPKFYSKSVPDVNKSSSMQVAMKEAADLSSDQSEDSPTPTFAQRVGKEQVREESPLDIFFKADREQKERQRLEKHGSSAGQNSTHGSPALIRPRHHSRHSTTGSQGGLFPMELESREPAKTSHEKPSLDPTTGGTVNNEPEVPQSGDSMETPQQAEQRKAKTIALKKLLMSSVPTATMPASYCQGTASQSTNGRMEPAILQPKRASNLQMQRQIAAQTARQTSPCPRSYSNLRTEVSASNLPEDGGPVLELPATPTPSQKRRINKSTPPHTQQHSSSVTQNSPAPSSMALETTPNPFKAMEDDLRRILKMNDLSSASPAGVAS